MNVVLYIMQSREGVRYMYVRKDVLKARDVMELIIYERCYATKQHGHLNSAHEGYAVLLEEMDELKAEVRNSDRDKEAMKKEAVQIAATAISFIIDCCGEE